MMWRLASVTPISARLCFTAHSMSKDASNWQLPDRVSRCLISLPCINFCFTDQINHLTICLSNEGFYFPDEPVFGDIGELVIWYTGHVLPIDGSDDEIMLQ